MLTSASVIVRISSIPSVSRMKAAVEKDKYTVRPLLRRFGQL